LWAVVFGAGDGVIKRIFRSRLPDRLAGRVSSWVVELGVGAAVAIALTAARLALHPLLGQQAPYAAIFFAVVIAAVLAGWRSGLVALVIGQALTWYAIVEPRWSVDVLSSESFGAFLFSTASQLLILAVIYFYQREVAHASAEQDRQMDLLSEALREIDHRTKNNYQTVVAVILLQAQRARQPEVKQALQDAADRVNAVSLASDQLALRSEDLGTVRLGDHLRELCAQIRRGMSRDGLQVECDVANLSASAEKAIFISIVVNELVTNALKHAFRDIAEGVIKVSSSHSADGLAIVVEDNGAGLERNRANKRSGLGTRLVERFVSEMGAAHKVTSSPAGTRHTILVPSLD
jgi:two-component system, sensor histidine kinase PdtaS